LFSTKHQLGTALPANGVLTGRPPRDDIPVGVVLHPDGSISTKFGWWGGNRASTNLRVTGKRLDGPSNPLSAHVGRAANPRFWPTDLSFPTPGCWKVIGRAGPRARVAFKLEVVAGSWGRDLPGVRRLLGP
jgi:hypothetical protein